MNQIPMGAPSSNACSPTHHHSNAHLQAYQVEFIAKDESIHGLSRDVEALQSMLHSEMSALRKTTRAEVRQMQVPSSAHSNGN